jgi:hypothetical protein
MMNPPTSTSGSALDSANTLFLAGLPQTSVILGLKVNHLWLAMWNNAFAKDDLEPS